MRIKNRTARFAIYFPKYKDVYGDIKAVSGRMQSVVAVACKLIICDPYKRSGLWCIKTAERHQEIVDADRITGINKKEVPCHS